MRSIFGPPGVQKAVFVGLPVGMCPVRMGRASIPVVSEQVAKPVTPGAPRPLAAIASDAPEQTCCAARMTPEETGWPPESACSISVKAPRNSEVLFALKENAKANLLLRR